MTSFPTLKPEFLTALVDSREQRPWDLAPFQQTTVALHVGDYSIQGLENVVAIERKSLPDFLMCCGRERARFQRELNSLRGWPVSAVIIECTWADICKGEWRSKLKPVQVKASVQSWIAQNHSIVFGGDVENCQELARGILFYAARYRWREASELARGALNE